MPKIRIYKLSKDIGKTSAEIIEKLKELGIEGKLFHTSSIDEKTAQEVCKAFNIKPPAVEAGHLEIGDDHRRACFSKSVQGVDAVNRLDDAKLVLFQCARQNAPGAKRVVDDERRFRVRVGLLLDDNVASRVIRIPC